MNDIVKPRIISKNLIYLIDKERVHSLEIFQDKIELKTVHEDKYILKDYCVVGWQSKFENSLNVLLTANKVLLSPPNSDTFEIVSSHLNSILDFHISNVNRLVLAIEKGDGNMNRLLAIKRMFRPIDKVFVSTKKAFFEKTTGIEDVKGLPLNGLIAVKIEGVYSLYQDTAEETAAFSLFSDARCSWIAESATTGGNYLVILNELQFRIYLDMQDKFSIDLQSPPDPNKLFLIEHFLIIVESQNNSIIIADLRTNTQSRIGMMIRE
jgi:hypothetical protein